MMPTDHPGPTQIHVFADGEALARAAADFLCRAAEAKPGRFAVCLSGGSTPRRMYESLGSERRADVPWDRVHWFFGDERFVPHDHADSNFGMVRRAMFDAAEVRAENIHPVATDAPSPQTAAQAYETGLKSFYGAAALDPQRLLFDLTLLGLGEDGHTASLFPATATLDDRAHWAAAVVGVKPEARITLTYPARESSRATAFLVSGASKKEILARVWRGDDLPAARLKPGGTLHWFIDRAADPR